MKTASIKADIVLVAVLAGVGVARADVYINEIYFDPPGSLDGTSEYIELRGTPGMSLSNYYLDLPGKRKHWRPTPATPAISRTCSIWAPIRSEPTAFSRMRQKNSPYSGYLAAVGTTDLVNTGTGSRLGQRRRQFDPRLTGSGRRRHRKQRLHRDVDPQQRRPSHRPPISAKIWTRATTASIRSARDVNQWRTNWTIVDSIGIHSESRRGPIRPALRQDQFRPRADDQHRARRHLRRHQLRNRADRPLGRLHRPDRGGLERLEPDRQGAGRLDMRRRRGLSPVGRPAPDRHGRQLVFPRTSTWNRATACPTALACATPSARRTTTCSPGDANGDGTVDGADLNTVLSNYNKASMLWANGNSTGMHWEDGDFDLNGAVDGADLNTVLSNYNRSLAWVAAVPEPASCVLLAVGICVGWLPPSPTIVDQPYRRRPAAASSNAAASPRESYVEIRECLSLCLNVCINNQEGAS